MTLVPRSVSVDPHVMLHQLDAQGDVTGIIQIEPGHPAPAAVGHGIALGNDLLIQEFGRTRRKWLPD